MGVEILSHYRVKTQLKYNCNITKILLSLNHVILGPEVRIITLI